MRSSLFRLNAFALLVLLGFSSNTRADLYGTVWDLRGNFTVGSGDYIRMTGDGNGDSFKYQDGYFYHNDSTMDFWQNAQIGLNNWAVFYQNGGQMNVGGWLSIARYGGSGYLEVNGGTVNSYNHQIIVGEVGYGSMTMNGGYAYTYQGVTLGQNGGSTGNLSLNGGTLEAGAIWKGGGTGNLGFNGGTLKATHDEWNFISGLNSANINGSAGIDNNGKGIGINQTLTGSGGLYLYGGGTTYLRQGNQYTGGTFINAGTLDLRGDQSYSSQYTIGNGARLNVTSDSIWFYNAPSFNFTSSGNGNITADSGNFIMSANTSYTTAGGARNLIDGSKGINLNGYTATFDVVRGTDANTDLTLSTVLWNSGGMVKTGNGIMKMSGVNSYSGETKVFAGTLMVDTGGSIATSSATVSSGATLKVNGAAGAVVLNGILSGTGTVGALTVESGGVVKITTASTTSTGAWNTEGTINFNSGSKIDVTGLTLSQQPYVLIRGSSVTGTPTLQGATGYTVSRIGNMIGLTPTVDTDGDGLTNYQEFQLGTDPNLADTDGDGIGDGVEVNTLGTSPIISHLPGVETGPTNSISGLTQTSVKLVGGITNLGGTTVTNAGFYLNTNSTATNGVKYSAPGTNFGLGSFSNTITGLTPGTSYYYRAFAANSVGTGYGANEYSFTTHPLSPFTYTTISGELTITGYTGTGGNLVIPATIEGLPVRVIGYRAFDDNKEITGVVVPEGITHISAEAFQRCNNLASITLPSTLVEIGSYAFLDCKIRNLEIPEGVIEIKNNAFMGCGFMETVQLPSTLIQIGNGAFDSCGQLTEIIIPANVRNIGVNAFKDCGLLGVVIFQGVIPPDFDGNAFSGIANGVTGYYPATASAAWGGQIILGLTLAPYPFTYTIANGNVTITGYTGTGGAVVIPATIGGVAVTTIGQNAFQSKSSVTAVVIPNGVTTIMDAAFAGCSGMTAITLPNSLTSIGGYVFDGCSSLQSITIPDGVTSIGPNAFAFCTSLPSITLPSGLNKIMSGTFWTCTNLTSITIPSSVNEIQYNAFLNCSKLASVNFLGNTPPTFGSPTPFGGVATGAKGYYPAMARSAWASLTQIGGLTIVHPDTQPPVITLIGANPLTIYKGSAFTDPGATVTDNRDVTRSITGTGTVITATVGNYTRNYNATDAAGNLAVQLTRTVNVVLDPVGDEDGDGVSNGAESAAGTNPYQGDSDSDGVSDGAEVAAGTNPNDSASAPNLPIAVADAFTAKLVVGMTTKVTTASLISNDKYSGIPGETRGVTFVSAQPTSSGGASIRIKGGWLIYQPSSSARIGTSDTFTYTVSNGVRDAAGALKTATGTVTVSLVSPDMTIEVALVSPATPANAYKATFLVMPGLVFEAYGSDTPDGIYTPIGSTWTSASSGKLEVTDTAAAGKSSRFYKLKWVP